MKAIAVAAHDVAPSHRESDENYHGIVTHLNDRWRAIVCQAGIQWILQYRSSAKSARRIEWRGRSYCHTRQALIRDARYHAGEISPYAMAVIRQLPERIVA